MYMHMLYTDFLAVCGLDAAFYRANASMPLHDYVGQVCPCVAKKRSRKRAHFLMGIALCSSALHWHVHILSCVCRACKLYCRSGSVAVASRARSSADTSSLCSLKFRISNEPNGSLERDEQSHRDMSCVSNTTDIATFDYQCA